MATSLKSRSPETRLPAALGSASARWAELIDALAKEHSPLVRTWKPSKLEFAAVCLLQHKDRTLVYLLPGAGQFEVSIVLGKRAAALAMESDLRASTKKLISEARVYAEGLGVRFAIHTPADVMAVVQLVKFKTTTAAKR